MTTRKNQAHSIKDRLLKLARARGEEFNFVLLRFAVERLLYRLSKSRHEEEFILKGAMLFAVWSAHPHRATKDLDLLGSGTPELERLAGIFRDICALSVEDDGVAFNAASVIATRIKEDSDFEAVRVKLDGRLGSARLSVQIDVGFGDAVIPAPITTEFPTLLALPAPTVRAYTRETVVAEKLHALVDLGTRNTRMKDFFDLWFLCQAFEFDGARLVQAIRATFAQRSTGFSPDPVALTESFARDPLKQTQWRAFLSRSRVAEKTIGLEQVVGTLNPFLGPMLLAASGASQVPSTWVPGGPWR